MNSVLRFVFDDIDNVLLIYTTNTSFSNRLTGNRLHGILFL